MSDDFEEMDNIELGQYADSHPDCGAAAAELMIRVLDQSRAVKGTDRTKGGRVLLLQHGKGPQLDKFGEDYDYNVNYIVREEETIKSLPKDKNDEDESGILVIFTVNGIREDYNGRARPDYSNDGAQYKGEESTTVTEETSESIPTIDSELELPQSDLTGNYTGVVDHTVDGKYAVIELIRGENVRDGNSLGQVTVHIEELPNEGRRAGAVFEICIQSGDISNIYHR